MTRRMWIYAAAGLIAITGVAAALLLPDACTSPYDWDPGRVCDPRLAIRVAIGGIGFVVGALVASTA